jgi:hypothetical protein
VCRQLNRHFFHSGKEFGKIAGKYAGSNIMPGHPGYRRGFLRRVATTAKEVHTMNRLLWVGPFVLRDYLLGLLDMTCAVWPPAGPGVYAVTAQPWTGRPAVGQVLYTGASGYMLNRIADFVRDVLGFYGPSDDGLRWVGRHSGAQTLWEYCDAHGLNVGQLLIGWAATSDPCHWCTEKEIARVLKPLLNKRTGKKTCCCPVQATR